MDHHPVADQAMAERGARPDHAVGAEHDARARSPHWRDAAARAELGAARSTTAPAATAQPDPTRAVASIMAPGAITAGRRMAGVGRRRRRMERGRHPGIGMIGLGGHQPRHRPGSAPASAGRIRQAAARVAPRLREIAPVVEEGELIRRRPIERPDVADQGRGVAADQLRAGEAGERTERNGPAARRTVGRSST